MIVVHLNNVISVLFVISNIQEISPLLSKGCIGVWHRGEKPTVKEVRVKWLYCVFYSLFLVSLVVGSVKSENMDESIFLAEMSINAAVFATKFWLFIWKQDEILNLLNRVCVFSIRNSDDWKRFDYKLQRFMKFVVGFAISINVAGISTAVIFPVYGSERTLFFEIGFPWDYRNNEIAFWAAATFLFIEVVMTISAAVFTSAIWYLLFVCSLRYEVLGSELRNMGRMDEQSESSKTFIQDVRASIKAHVHLRKLVNGLESFFQNLFLIQFGTSGLCICGSIYCLAFNVADNMLERFIHLLAFLFLIADLFTITYFGNEIKLSSERLFYSLFESVWYNEPQSTKKCIIIFGEYLKEPQKLVIGKLYPLTLETFTRILNSAYSMFNILKSFQ